MEGAENLVRYHCLRNEIPIDVVKRLLECSNPLIVSAAVWGEWFAEPKNSVRLSLKETWRNAVIKCVVEDYLLCQIFNEDRPLAYLWLQEQLMNYPNDHY